MIITSCLNFASHAQFTLGQQLHLENFLYRHLSIDTAGALFACRYVIDPLSGAPANNAVYHALVKYLPCFEDVRPVNMWAGQRAVNSRDTIPVVAPAPGMIYVGAATGNGILKSDALGRIVAALHAGDEEAELYGGRRFRVADLGVATRNVERETFKV